MSEASQLSTDVDVSDPFMLPCGAIVKNRLVKAAMSEQLGTPDREPSRGLGRLYNRWAKGDIGVLITGNIMVDRFHLGEPKNVVLDESSDFTLFRHWTEAATIEGTHLWAQLNHPGKQCFMVARPVAPSAIKLDMGRDEATFAPPRELGEEEIWSIVRKFATSARLAKKVGFTGVQIHAAHGYLASQFLSPRHNQRVDRWGGSLENRMRFLLEIYRATRVEVGDDFPISVKLNTADFTKDGFSESDSIAVIETLSDVGVDLVEVSGGSYENMSFVHGKDGDSGGEEAYFLSHARKAREKVDVPLVVTGGFRTRDSMNRALTDRSTDLIGLGRPLILDPRFASKVLHGQESTVPIKPRPAGVSVIDNNPMITTMWYEQQLALMARNKDPDL
ncbi:MAG: NADH:flavin oxidoreductase/NADH oxidase family protein, partial [Proteobacteria bacterium]|nr:NADH:flavin oxidoreductase/NADH oxidase family protein [Pseudomonadota bacterium]